MLMVRKLSKIEGSDPMNWHWKIRLIDSGGEYWTCQVKTGRNLDEIEIIRSFYSQLTGGRILLEGMSESAYTELSDIRTAFEGLFHAKV